MSSSNGIVSHSVSTINPVLATIASALRLQCVDDAAAVRSIDRAVAHLSTGLAYEFDGVELRITSFSRRESGMVHVCDVYGGCTCEGSKRSYCWHRAALRLLMAEMALSNPHMLATRIVEQVSPLDLDTDDGGYDEYGDFLQDLPASRPTRAIDHVAAQAAADSLFS